MKAIFRKKNTALNEFQIVECDEVNRLNYAKNFLGNVTVAFVRLNEDSTFWLACDEDGLMKQLEFNFFLEVAGFRCSRIDAIVGDVVFIKTKPINQMHETKDYEVTDITADDYKLFMSLLSQKKQLVLYEKYKKQCGRKD